MVNLGVIGVSPGNGHPFSFSAIVNGYDADPLIAAGWGPIAEYLGRRTHDEFGFRDVRVTHAWTQERGTSDLLAAACGIDRIVESPLDMAGEVDAIMVLRDDPDSHLALALPFLEAGTPVFVDKPLTVSRDELAVFAPHLEAGRLMSCSGLRFATELDGLRDGSATIGDLLAIRGAVLFSWTRYGIHLIDAVLGAVGLLPISVQRLPGTHESMLIETAEGAGILLDALGEVPKVFSLTFYGRDGHHVVELSDNFGAFRRTIAAFLEMVKTGEPAINPVDTLTTIRTLLAGREAQPGGPPVPVTV